MPEHHRWSASRIASKSAMTVRIQVPCPPAVRRRSAHNGQTFGHPYASSICKRATQERCVRRECRQKAGIRRLRSPDRLCGGSTEEQGTDLQLDDLCATGRPRKEQTTQKRATGSRRGIGGRAQHHHPRPTGDRTHRLGLAPVHGGNQWAPSSVKALLDRARAAGLLAPTWRQPLSVSEARAPALRRPRRYIAIGVENFEGSGLQPPART